MNTKLKVQSKAPAKSYYDIFYYILSKGKTTRRDIEKDTMYSWGTVSTQVCALLDQKFVTETESFSNGLGRNTYFLTPNSNIVTIGVDLNTMGVSCSVAGIDGIELQSFFIPYNAKTQKDVLNLVFSAFDLGFEWAKNNNLNIFSIGLSCQGGVNNNGEIFEHFYFIDDWEPINIKKMLEERYHIYVFVSNDISPLVADYSRRYNFDNKSIMIVRMVGGIGFGFTGLNDFSELGLVKSDFGHMIMVPNGEKCICGKRGCLEAYGSIGGILRQIGLPLDNYEELFHNAHKYQKYIDEAATMIGVGIINVISGFRIDRIVLTGKMVELGPDFINKIQETYDKYKGNIEPNIKLEVISDLSASLGVSIKASERKVLDGKL